MPPPPKKKEQMKRSFLANMRTRKSKNITYAVQQILKTAPATEAQCGTLSSAPKEKGHNKQGQRKKMYGMTLAKNAQQC